MEKSLSVIAKTTKEADELIRMYPLEVMSVIAKRLHTNDQDLIHDLYIEVLEKIHNYDCKHSLTTFICAYSFNRYRTMIRTDNRRSVYFTNYQICMGRNQSTSEEPSLDQFTNVFKRVMSEFSLRDQKIISAYFLEEKKIMEIVESNEAGLKRGSVGKIIVAFKKKMRRDWKSCREMDTILS